MSCDVMVSSSSVADDVVSFFSVLDFLPRSLRSRLDKHGRCLHLGRWLQCTAGE